MAISTGLEGKAWYYGFLVGLAVAIALVVATHYLLVTDLNTQIKAAEAELDDLARKIEAGRAAEKKLPQFREEVARLELELEKLRRILPSTRNTEEIIKKIKSLVDQGDFTLHSLVFPKLAIPESGGEIYAEWPIAVSLEGGFHNLAILFNRLGNFSRIVNVESCNITALTNQTEHTISADFIAKTFVYVEPKEQPAKPAGKPKPGGAPAKTDEGGAE